jgi:hypothetical protein
MTESIAVHLLALLHVYYAYTLRNVHEAASDSCRGKTVENITSSYFTESVTLKNKVWAVQVCLLVKLNPISRKMKRDSDQ